MTRIVMLIRDGMSCVCVCVRCTNAEPNYGTAWFFCRQHPLDTPVAVMRRAHHTLTHELVSAQPLYTRAVFAFVLRCLKEGEATREDHGAVASLDSSQSLSSELDHETGGETRPRRPSSAPLYGARKVNGNSGIDCAARAVETRRNVQEELSGAGKDSSESISDCSDQAVRERVLLEDMEELLASVSLPDRPFAVVNGVTYCPQDFVTAVVGQNKEFYTSNLSDEDRRRCLFGSDQILP